MRKIFFRVDSSIQIGSGHLMRCLTLAKQLGKQEITFVCRKLEGNLNKLVNKNGFVLLELPESEPQSELNGYEKWLTVTQQVDAGQMLGILENTERVDLLIVDSYALDKTWEDKLRQKVKYILVIDDLANRQHNCDWLLDQNYYHDAEKRYTNLVPPECKLLLGPQYVLLREEFYQARRTLRKRDGSIKNILVFFGGSDPSNETGKTLEALIQLKTTDITINVVVGASNPHKDSLRLICEENKFNYLCQVNNMAELIAEADFAIGAGGTTTWERCFLELPSIVIILAENQRELTEQASKENIIYSYFDTNNLDGEKFQETFVECLTMRNKVKRISDKCRKFMPTIKPNWQKILLGADT